MNGTMTTTRRTLRHDGQLVAGRPTAVALALVATLLIAVACEPAATVADGDSVAAFATKKAALETLPVAEDACVRILTPTGALVEVSSGTVATANVDVVAAGYGLAVGDDIAVVPLLDGQPWGDEVGADGLVTFANVPVGPHMLTLACRDRRNGQDVRGAYASLQVRVLATFDGNCGRSGGDDRCASDHVCAADSCVDRRVNGRPVAECRFGWQAADCCQNVYDCAPGLLCDTARNRCAECAVDFDCEPRSACETGTCEAGVCVFRPIDGECCSDAECDDNLICTTDRCVAGMCQHLASEDPECCEGTGDAAVECPGASPCRAAACVANRCVYTANPRFDCCVTSDSECDDGNDCTRDTCDTDRNQCLWTTEVERPECCDNAVLHCDDGDPATLARCTFHHCVFVRDPLYCDEATPCEPAENPCVQKVCDLARSRCILEPVFNCCQTDRDCFDRDGCTTDRCVEGQCVYTPKPDCCHKDQECSDGNACTVDRCIGNRCVFGPDPQRPGCCNADLDCEDGDPCTANTCLPERVCRTVTVPGGGCCEWPEDCYGLTRPDGTTSDDATEWRCHQRRCVWDARDCRRTMDGCDDGNPCTADRCNTRTGRCEHSRLQGCCRDAADCDDGDTCTEDRCNPAGVCVYKPRANCCQGDSQCSDNDLCTEDRCHNGRCLHIPRAGCCRANVDCDDGNPCTRNRCDQKTRTCTFDVERGTGCCMSDAQCDDGINSTADRCLNNRCENIPIDICTTHEDCDDNDVCTSNWCVFGRCRYLPPTRQTVQLLPDECCSEDVECPVPTDPCVHVACVQGRCRLAAVEECRQDGRFNETFSRFDVPAGWEVQAVPPQQRDRVEFGPDPGVDEPPTARVEPATNPNSSTATVAFVSPFTAFDYDQTYTLQVEHRADDDSSGLLTSGRIEIAISEGPDEPWQTVHSEDLSSVGSLVWRTDNVDVSQLAGRDRGRIRLLYQGQGRQRGWRIKRVSVDRGRPPVVTVSEGTLTAPVYQESAVDVVAVAEDNGGQEVWLSVNDVPSFGTLTDQRQLTPEEIEEQTGTPEGSSGTLTNSGVSGTLTVQPGGQLTDGGEPADLGTYEGEVVASSGYLIGTAPVEIVVTPAPEPEPEPVCGDGVVQGEEECDAGDDNSDVTPGACRTDCRLPRCGDGVHDAGEVCEPSRDFGCRADCQYPRCGDGVRDAGEACDTGDLNSLAPGAFCRPDCTQAGCGDGILDPDEACDEGAATGDADRSLCLPGCMGYGLLTSWPPAGEATIAFEDLPITSSNDYDYNDWVSTITVEGLSIPGGRMWGLVFANRPMARGAGYRHDQYIRVPGSLLTSSGTLIVRRYSPEGLLVSESAPIRFNAGQNLDILSIADTSKALPKNPGSSYSNVDPCLGYVEGDETRASLLFDAPIDLSFGSLSPDAVGPHGDGLFFDPYIRVINTGEEIHQGDRRMLAVPRTWRWPLERKAIWTAYPACVFAGNPPTFADKWYNCAPNDFAWRADCSEPEATPEPEPEPEPEPPAVPLPPVDPGPQPAPGTPVNLGSCETAYAMGERTFIQLGITNSRWGWEIEVDGPSTVRQPIYAAAAKNDIRKGVHVGYLNVRYDGAEIIVDYELFPGVGLDETHVYVGASHVSTTAPGAYGHIHSNLGRPRVDRFRIPMVGAPVYVVAHAVVCSAP